MLKLYIGNKNYSSWSMRPWVLLTQAGIPFEEVMVRFDSFDAGSAFKQAVGAQNPVGKVPVLVDDGFAVWDTLAIAETLAEQFPEKQLWPADRAGPRPRPQRLRRDAQRLRRPAQRLPDEHRGVAARHRRAGAARPARRARRPGAPGGDVERTAGAARRPDAVRRLHHRRRLLRAGRHAHQDLRPAGAAAVAAYIERVCALPGVKAWIDGALAEKDFLDFEEPYRLRRD